jgi:peptidoglycan hydrolase-like protein with peptidoglycan-binding domain
MARSQLQAAQELKTHINAGGARGKKGAPNAVVKAAQTDMGMAAAERDGIYGPKTQAKMDSLIAAAALATQTLLTPRTPKQAAQDLQVYVNTKGVNLGSKTNPATAIKAAQKDMGMPTSEHDGIWGPKTQAQMNTLLAIAALPPAPTPPPVVVSEPAVVPPPPVAAVITPKPTVSAPVTTPKPVASVPVPSVSKPAAVTVKPATPAVQQALASIPSQAKAPIAEALNNFATDATATADDFDALINSLATSVAPSLQALSDAVKLQDVQREATSESKTLRMEDERWANAASTQQLILEKIKELALKVAANDAVSKRAYSAYGVKLS